MKKLLPPKLLFISAILIITLGILFPVLRIIIFPYTLSGILLIISGGLVSAMASGLFKKLDTNIKTFDEPGKLVTTGLFRYSRNPMYCGFIMVLAGLTILTGALSPYAVLVTFILITDRWYISHEERAMILKFGMEYLAYKKKVRKYI